MTYLLNSRRDQRSIENNKGFECRQGHENRTYICSWCQEKLSYIALDFVPWKSKTQQYVCPQTDLSNKKGEPYAADEEVDGFDD